jgi:hypothetical protein
MAIWRKLMPGAPIKHFWRAIVVIALLGAGGLVVMSMLRQGAPPSSQGKTP